MNSPGVNPTRRTAQQVCAFGVSLDPLVQRPPLDMNLQRITEGNGVREPQVDAEEGEHLVVALAEHEPR